MTKDPLKFINKYRARMGQRELNPSCPAGGAWPWTQSDIEAEAIRLGWKPPKSSVKFDHSCGRTLSYAWGIFAVHHCMRCAQIKLEKTSREDLARAVAELDRYDQYTGGAKPTASDWRWVELIEKGPKTS